MAACQRFSLQAFADVASFFVLAPKVTSLDTPLLTCWAAFCQPVIFCLQGLLLLCMIVDGRILYISSTTPNINYNIGFALQSPFSGAICEGTYGSTWSCTIPNSPTSFGVLGLVSGDYDIFQGTVSYTDTDWNIKLNGTTYPNGSVIFSCTSISSTPYCQFQKAQCQWGGSGLAQFSIQVC